MQHFDDDGANCALTAEKIRHKYHHHLDVMLSPLASL